MNASQSEQIQNTEEGYPDFAKLTEMREELGDHFLLVMQHFQSGMLARPQKIRQAFQNNNPEQLALEGHSFKSLCRQLGLSQMETLSVTLESMGRSGQLDGAAPLIERLLAYGLQAHCELQKYCLACGKPSSVQ
ncbi:MAG: Hpt domain-containing protein [Magnetococcales bacterium]|nr:Hpt domain-containing protein [Magnetococcales bacterium]